MIVAGSGPHVVEHLKGRVESLTNALERAQDRINELERVFGSEAELLPLQRLGLTPNQARIVHLLRTKELVTGKQIQFAMYADDPDRMNEADSKNVMGVQISMARKALKRYGIGFDTVGRGSGAEGYHMPGSSKSRLAKLIASGARSGVSMRRAAE